MTALCEDQLLDETHTNSVISSVFFKPGWCFKPFLLNKAPSPSGICWPLDGGEVSTIKRPNLAMSADVAEIATSVKSEMRVKAKLRLERFVLNFLSIGGLEEEAVQRLIAAAQEALIFINDIPSEIPLPVARAALDGMVTLEWITGEKKAAVMFEGAEDYGYTYFRNGTFVPGETIAYVGAGVPKDLNAYLAV